MITFPLGLYFIAFCLTLVSGITGRLPLWIPVLLISIALMIGGYGGGGRI